MWPPAAPFGRNLFTLDSIVGPLAIGSLALAKSSCWVVLPLFRRGFVRTSSSAPVWGRVALVGWLHQLVNDLPDIGGHHAERL